jgi:cytochrome b561
MDDKIKNDFLSTQSYSDFPKLLHWVIAAIVIGLLCLGWYMVSVENQPGSDKYFDLHKSFGLIAATLIAVRIVWRFNYQPRPIPSIPHWQEKLVRSSHLLLYGFMVAMPLTGFLASSLSEYGVAFFGRQLPSWIHQNKSVSEQLFTIHGYLAWGFAGLIIVHILAALKHLLINKDDVFQRMWFGSGK